MSNQVLNTFSFKEAKRMEKETSYYIVNDLNIQLIPMNFILEEIKLPSFISIDIEGLDYKVLKSLNIQKYRPAVIVAETLTFEPKTGGKKIKKIIKLMLEKNYKIFADTRLNTIFIDANKFK